MTEPYQQPSNPDDTTSGNASPETAQSMGTSPAVPTASSTPAQSAAATSESGQYTAPEPQYGQRIQPEYGALASQFPANYNPYLYGGAPTQEAAASSAQGSPQGPAGAPMPGYAGSDGRDPYPYPYYGSPQGSGSRNPLPGDADYVPNYYHGIDLNDPRQNPMYGRWDAYAIISFIVSLFFAMPVLPAVMGVIAIWRTRKFHTKGFALAVAAIIINVLVTIGMAWLALNGYSIDDVYAQMLNMMGYGSTSDQDVISAMAV